jgi:hypothetical protein
MNELVMLVKRLPARSQSDPAFAAFTWAAADLASKALRKEMPISAIRVKKFCATTQFRSSRLAASEFVPPVSLAEGLARTIAYEFLGGREHYPGPRTLFESE